GDVERVVQGRRDLQAVRADAGGDVVERDRVVVGVEGVGLDRVVEVWVGERDRVGRDLDQLVVGRQLDHELDVLSGEQELRTDVGELSGSRTRLRRRPRQRVAGCCEGVDRRGRQR